MTRGVICGAAVLGAAAAHADIIPVQGWQRTYGRVEVHYNSTQQVESFDLASPSPTVSWAPVPQVIQASGQGALGRVQSTYTSVIGPGTIRFDSTATMFAGGAIPLSTGSAAYDQRFLLEFTLDRAGTYTARAMIQLIPGNFFSSTGGSTAIRLWRQGQPTTIVSLVAPPFGYPLPQTVLLEFGPSTIGLEAGTYHVEAFDSNSWAGGQGGGVQGTLSFELLEVSCYPDCDQNGTLSIADFGCFQTRFVAGDPYADCDGNSTLSVSDFGCFQTLFVGGCP